MIKRVLIIVATVLLFGFWGNSVLAIKEGYNDICGRDDVAKELKVQAGCFENRGLPNVIFYLINIAIGLIGVVAVVVMIQAGFKFMMSNGEAGEVAKARRMIFYGVIGLVLASSAFVIINFVLKSIK